MFSWRGIFGVFGALSAEAGFALALAEWGSALGADFGFAPALLAKSGSGLAVAVAVGAGHGGKGERMKAEG